MAQSSNPLEKLKINTSANKNSVHTWRQGISLEEFRCVFGQKGHKGFFHQKTLT
jgi:hypothetical protein